MSINLKDVNVKADMLFEGVAIDFGVLMIAAVQAGLSESVATSWLVSRMGDVINKMTAAVTDADKVRWVTRALELFPDLDIKDVG